MYLCVKVSLGVLQNILSNAELQNYAQVYSFNIEDAHVEDINFQILII